MARGNELLFISFQEKFVYKQLAIANDGIDDVIYKYLFIGD